MNRGSAGQSSLEEERAFASMRPRFMNRGSGTRTPGDIYVVELQ